MFASHLKNFCKNIDYLFEPEEILQDYTAYPYFSPFISPERQERAFNSTLFKANSLSSSIGSHFLIEDSKRFKWCFDCAVEDMNNYGEVYLHRSHQLPGIEICLKHSKGLLDYELDSEFSILDNYNYFNPDLSKDYSIRPALDYEKRLAVIASELLELSFHQFNIDDILKMLRILFIDQGLATRKLFYYSKIYKRITEIFPEEFLKKYNLIIEDLSKNNWIKKVLLKKKIVHPIECIVLIALVSESFEGFVKEAQEKLKEIEIFSDFGVCHNPFCRFYNKPGARRLSIDTNNKFALYRCECNQIYKLFRDNHYHIVQLGSLYGEEIKRLRENGMSFQKIGDICNISRNGIKKQLQRSDYTPVDNKILSYKNQILSELENNPDVERKELNIKFNPAFDYLSSYEPEFIKSLEIPFNKYKFKDEEYVLDKEQKDSFYSEQVQEIAEKLYEKLPEVMVSKCRIVEMLEPKISMSSYKTLKKTSALVDFYSETKHDYYKRKLVHQIQDQLKRDPGFQLTKENVKTTLGVTKKKLDLYWSEIVTIVTKQ